MVESFASVNIDYIHLTLSVKILWCDRVNHVKFVTVDLFSTNFKNHQFFIELMLFFTCLWFVAFLICHRSLDFRCTYKILLWQFSRVNIWSEIIYNIIYYIANGTYQSNYIRIWCIKWISILKMWKFCPQSLGNNDMNIYFSPFVCYINHVVSG